MEMEEDVVDMNQKLLVTCFELKCKDLLRFLEKNQI